MRVVDTTIVRYAATEFDRASWSCASKSIVMETNMLNRGTAMDSSDAVPPHFFSGITIDGTSRENLALLNPPDRNWITETKCVVMDCDGPKKVLIHDLDGSLTGTTYYLLLTTYTYY